MDSEPYNSVFDNAKDDGFDSDARRRINRDTVFTIGFLVATSVFTYDNINEKNNANFSKLGELVNSNVEGERIYSDTCKNSMTLEEVSSNGSLLEVLNIANDVRPGKTLYQTIKENGNSVKIPRDYLDAKFDCR